MRQKIILLSRQITNLDRQVYVAVGWTEDKMIILHRRNLFALLLLSKRERTEIQV